MLKLASLEVPVGQLQDFFGFQQTNDSKYIYHNYFTANVLKDALLSTPLVQKYNIIDDIIVMITEYYGIIGWSNIDKSDNINIIESTDKIISYAVLKNKKIDTSVERTFYNLILFNEWIDINCNKKIFKYIFKVDKIINSQMSYSDFSELNIGFITPKFIKNINIGPKKLKFKELSHADLDNIIGRDKHGNSIRWSSDGETCEYVYKSDSIADRVCTINWKGFVNAFEKMKDFNKYFLFEINLIKNIINVKCNAMLSGNKIYQHDIPAALLKSIEETQQFKICAMLFTRDEKPFSIGIVRV